MKAPRSRVRRSSAGCSRRTKRAAAAQDLAALLRFGIESSQGGECDEEEVNTLAQQIWQLYSKDVEGGGWAETVAEDHSDALGAGGNHIRSVVRNELRPVAERLLKIERANAAMLTAVEEKLAAMQQAHGEQMATVIEMLGKLSR